MDGDEQVCERPRHAANAVDELERGLDLPCDLRHSLEARE